jgi:hypothetical protein
VGVTAWHQAAGTIVVTNTFYDGRNLKTAESVPHLQTLTVPGLSIYGR